MSALSVEVPTQLSRGHAAEPLVFLPDFFQAAPPPQLVYPSLLDTVVRRPLFDSSLHLHPDLFDKIVTPYHASAFDALLTQLDLTGSYPDLVTCLLGGFPIGDMPPLSSTHIIDNHSLLFHHDTLVDDYLSDEVASGRLDGPFTKEDVTRILRGLFHSLPLIVVIQPQAPGEPDKIRICRHLSKSKDSILSVNSFIRATFFPTRFDTAARVAELVSFSLSFLCTPLAFMHTVFLFILPCL
jgi:hypothetical protein